MVIAHAETGPKPDVLFVLPFEDPSGPASRSVALSTRIHSLDVFVLAATTGSMGAARFRNISSGLPLVRTDSRGFSRWLDDAQFGVGTFQDFPISPYGSPATIAALLSRLTRPAPFILKLKAITNNLSALADGDREPQRLRMWRRRTRFGAGSSLPGVGRAKVWNAPAPTSVPSNHTGVGGVGYRPDAGAEVVVDISNYLSHGVGETGELLDDGRPRRLTRAPSQRSCA